MPGPEDLTQRLLWLGATQSLCARAEESGASAEIVELHQNDLALTVSATCPSRISAVPASVSTGRYGLRGSPL